MKQILALIIVLILVLILVSPVVTARADSGPPGGPWHGPPDKGFDDGNRRSLMYKVWDDRVTVLSTGKSDGRPNVFYFTLQLDDIVAMHFNYFRGPNSEEMERFHDDIQDHRKFPENGFGQPPYDQVWDKKPPFEDLGMSLSIQRLREFNETENNVSLVLFKDKEFVKPSVTNMTTNDTFKGLEIRTSTVDGIFGLTFYLSITGDNESGSAITPFEIKYDIEINDYPFVADDSMIALESIFSLPEEVSQEPWKRMFDGPEGSNVIDPEKERTIGYDIHSASMFFSWATNVTVDGEEHDVIAEYSEKVVGGEEMVERITFIYPAGKSILHDPKIGVADFMEYAEDTAEFVEHLISWSSGLGVGIVLIVLVAVRLKPRKFDWED